MKKNSLKLLFLFKKKFFLFFLTTFIASHSAFLIAAPGGIPYSSPDGRRRSNIGTGIINSIESTTSPAGTPNTSDSNAPDPASQNGAVAKGKGEADKGKEKSEAELAQKREQDRFKQLQQDKDLAAAAKRARDLNAQKSKTPQQQSQIKDDIDLIEKAREQKKKDQLFAEKEARKAHDDEIRRRLLAISDAQVKHQEFKKEEARLTNQIAEFSNLAAQMMQAGTVMGSIKNPNIAPLQTAPKSGVDSSSVSQQPATDKEDSRLTDETQARLDALEKSIALDSKVDSTKSAASKPKDYSLKKALLAKLAAGEKLSASEMKSLGNGSPTEGDASNVSAKREAPATNVTEDFLESPVNQNSGGSPKFSMRGSETDAEVKRLVDGEASRGLASVDPIQADGVLETDSPSLFDRVKSHISACLRQRCVASAYIAK
ncbi:MAG: hypothetical protein AB7K68_04075 [Bacteriovoracia bacterium]